MEVRSDPFESAKSNLFDTSSWGDFCDVTLTLKQGHQPDSGGWVKTDDYPLNAVVEPGAVAHHRLARAASAAPLARARIRREQVNAGPSTQLLNRGAVAHHPLTWGFEMSSSLFDHR